LEAWSVVEVDATINGGMSIAVALYLLPTGLAIAAWSSPIRKRQRLAEALATLMLAQALILLGAHLFDAWATFQGGKKAPTEMLTLVSIMLLTGAVMIRHLRTGMYQLIVGLGIGSAFLRIGLPWMFVLPFVIVLVALATVELGGLDMRYTAALTAALASLITLLFSLNIARKLNGLEAELRSLSLTDPLTGLHNRRGFEILGEQRFHEAERSREKVALLFFDIDGLKQVNDRYGHDIGSRLIKDFADLLTHKFRHSDVLGRLGGDEFAVLVHDGDDAEACVKQLTQAAESANIENSRPYAIEFSVGIEYGSPRTGDTLLDLITRADNSMYLKKRAKRESSRWLGDTAAADSV
jgi:diguanylate cyclase (GGDEF)-like protein